MMLDELAATVRGIGGGIGECVGAGADEQGGDGAGGEPTGQQTSARMAVDHGVSPCGDSWAGRRNRRMAGARRGVGLGF
jgi:hypothetical protein